MKTNIFRLIAFLSILGPFFSSCEKDNSNNQIDALIPLKTGNSWTYEIFQNSKSGLESSTVTTVVGELIGVNGIKGYQFLSGTSPYNSTFLVNCDVAGNFLIIGGYSEVDTLLATSIIYKKDAIKGESWDYEDVHVSYDSGIFEQETLKVYCISSDTLILTPLGSFSCIAYEYSRNSGSDIFRDYVSKGVGRIKSEHYENGFLFSYNTLVDYQLK